MKSEKKEKGRLMSKKRAAEIVRRNSSPASQSISTEVGLEAARKIAEEADAEGVEYALAGGLAMHLYGFTRATRDVDFIADGLLSLDAMRQLSIGGEVYKIKVGKRDVEIDWIVRDDDKADVYEAALENAVDTDLGLPIVSPEWLVILKKLADRGKDHLDLLWLLRAEGLVDRAEVAKIARGLFGKFAYLFLQDIESVYLEADLMKARDAQSE